MAKGTAKAMSGRRPVEINDERRTGVDPSHKVGDRLQEPRDTEERPRKSGFAATTLFRFHSVDRLSDATMRLHVASHGQPDSRGLAAVGNQFTQHTPPT